MTSARSVASMGTWMAEASSLFTSSRSANRPCSDGPTVATTANDGEGRRQRGDGVLERATANDRGDLGVLEDGPHLGRRQPVVKGHGHGADLVDRAVGDDEVEDLLSLEIDGDQVPLPDALGLQTMGQPV